jgi:large subunit ribosomal protein L5
MAEAKGTKDSKGAKGQAKGGPPAPPSKSKEKAKGGGATDPAPKASEGKPRLQSYYEETVRGRLQKQFGLGNRHEVPRLQKVVLNVGMGDGAKNPKSLEAAAEELATITGQRPIITRAKKAISNFSLRAGVPIGCAVTLRGARMYEFLDRFINIALPRVRDFRGVTERSFDGNGNYAVGIKEHIIFPEIDYDKIDRVWGMDVVICTTAKTDEEARALIAGFNFPFRKAHRGTKAAA